MFLIVSILIVVAIIATIVRRLASISSFVGNPGSWLVPSTWSIAEGKHDGQTIVTKFNMALRPAIGHAAFPHRLSVMIPIRRPAVNGLPDRTENRQLLDIERTVEQTLVKRNESLFAGVITTGGMRELVIYTSNVDGAMDKLQALAQEITTHSYQVSVRDDPDWQVYQSFAR